jgi:hypothetical protein
VAGAWHGCYASLLFLLPLLLLLPPLLADWTVRSSRLRMLGWDGGCHSYLRNQPANMQDNKLRSSQHTPT